MTDPNRCASRPVPSLRAGYSTDRNGDDQIVHQLLQGHCVDVVTSLPWYEHHRVLDRWRGRPWRRETTPWGSVARVHPFPTDKTNIPARALGFAGFTALVGLLALARRSDPMWC